VKRLLVFNLSCVIALVCGLSFAQESKPAKNKAVEQELTKLTEEITQAEVHKDVPAMERLFAEDFTHTHADGAFEKKADYVNDIKVGTRNYEIIDLSDMQVRPYGPCAVIIGHVRIKNVYNGKAGDTINSFMATWVQQQGKWKLAAWATTRGPQPGAH
jgi:hypothetical protein